MGHAQSPNETRSCWAMASDQFVLALKGPSFLTIGARNLAIYHYFGSVGIRKLFFKGLSWAIKRPFSIAAPIHLLVTLPDVTLAFSHKHP